MEGKQAYLSFPRDDPDITQGAKLEVESIVRETSEKVLSDPSISREKRELRAVALGMMGEVGRQSLFKRD